MKSIELQKVFKNRKYYFTGQILITGGADFISSHVAEYYARKGKLDVDPRHVFPGTWVYLVFSAVFIESLLVRWRRFRHARFENLARE